MKKIFIGLTDIASQISAFEKGFNSNGIDTLTAIRREYNKVDEVNYDFIISPQNKLEALSKKSVLQKLKTKVNEYKRNQILWKKALIECDTFLFIYSSFRNNHSDYKMLKKKGKNIITIFVGSDIRWVPGCNQEFDNYSMRHYKHDIIKSTLDFLQTRLTNLRYAEKYSDIILSVPNLSVMALRPYNTFKVPIDLDEFIDKESVQKVIPTIVHAASAPIAKGTKYVKAVFDRLLSEGIDFKPMILDKVPYNQIKSLYRNADVLVGQLFAPGGGKQERELLAMNKVVLTNMSYHYPQNIPGDCPIVDVNIDNLYDKLKSVILDYSLRVKLAKKGRDYIKKYHDVNILTKEIIELVLSNNPKPDFYPIFFRDYYKPVYGSKEVKILNKYNETIKYCDWYKKHVKPGNRAGLKF